MVNLGYFYEVGDGSTDPKRVFDRPYGIVPRDYDKAAEWYNKAANLGNGEAKYLLNKLLEKHPASKIQSVEKKCNPN